MTRRSLPSIVVDTIRPAALDRPSVHLVKVRRRGPSELAMRARIAAATALTGRHAFQPVIDDHRSIVLDPACGRVHLGQLDPGEAQLDALRCAEVLHGPSTRNPGEPAG